MGAGQSKSVERPQLRVPSSGDEPFAVVGCRRIRFPDGPTAQVFFPAREIDDEAAARKAQKAYPYMRREAFDGLVSWLRKPMFVMKTFGIHLWHTPCSPSAHPLSPMDKGDNGTSVPETGLPVMIFSHGLGGHSDLHAALGQLMARKGFVVFALEHECRAGSYARRESGTVLTYDRPPELTKEQKKEGYQLYLKLCQEFREPFLDHRESECVFIQIECSQKHRFPRHSLSYSPRSHSHFSLAGTSAFWSAFEQDRREFCRAQETSFRTKILVEHRNRLNWMFVHCCLAF